MDILEKKKEGIMYILEKKEEEEEWIEKEWVKDLIPYLQEIDKLIRSRKPYPCMRKEIDVLKRIKSELKMQINRIHKKLVEPRAAYDKVFQEISRMPGTSRELEDLLDSDDNFDFCTKLLITENRFDNLDDVYGEKESDIKRKDFLRAKSVELSKAEILKISPQFGLVQMLLQCAKSSLRMIDLYFHDRYAPSSSTKDEKGKKRDIVEDNVEESSSRKNKKGKKRDIVEDNIEESSAGEISSSRKDKKGKKRDIVEDNIKESSAGEISSSRKIKKGKKRRCCFKSNP